MRIDRDTFKDGLLYFGPHESSQRDALFYCRWEQFANAFEEKHPEITIKILGTTKYSKRIIILDNLIDRISFKYRVKLSYALVYDEMESVNSSEFDKIIIKFKKYVQRNQFKNLFDD